MRTSRSIAGLTALGLLVIAHTLGGCEDSNDTDAGAREDSGNAGAGGAGGAQDDSGQDAGDEDDAGGPCRENSDCSDGLTCNGRELCVNGSCQPGAPTHHCTPTHPCVEPGICECSNPDADGDGSKAQECIPSDQEGDCDDSKMRIHVGAAEVCDPDGVDEDCDPSTFSDPNDPHDGDADGDGYISLKCSNPGASGSEPHAGNDCDDENPSIHPGAKEQCDYKDEDCNGLVDEGTSSTGEEHVEHALQDKFYPDVDRDGYGDMSADPMFACSFDPPPYTVAASQPDDCDDLDSKRNNEALEKCDGKDNDCDGKIDAEDDDLFREYDFEGTELACQDGAWVITSCPTDQLWCPPDPVRFGCTTDATTLSNCHGCGLECTFACGSTSCDEVTGLALGTWHSCALTSGHTVACWGRGGEGRLGNEGARSLSVASQVAGISDAVAIASGFANSCAVRDDEAKELWCWGDNADYLLGNLDPGQGFSTVPLPVAGPFGESVLGGVDSVSIAQRSACAVTQTGALYCWGNAEGGRLGIGETLQTVVPTPRFAVRELNAWVTDAAQVALGEQHGCMRTLSGTVECWGDNTYGQLGDPDFFDELSEIVRPVPGLDEVEMIAAGALHTCALRHGQVLCWGINDRYQLGRESDGDESTPLPAGELEDIVSITASLAFTCALDANGDVWCWGGNDAGERGDDDVDGEDTATPVQVRIDHVVSLSAGGTHVCALTEDRQVSCWGANTLGQLGTGMTTPLPGPEPQTIRPLKR